MSPHEPKNPFYLLLLLASLMFVATALAYALVPKLASWRDGWKWLLYEVGGIIVFAGASMGLDRLRSLKKERAARTIAALDENSATV